MIKPYLSVLAGASVFTLLTSIQSPAQNARIVSYEPGVGAVTRFTHPESALGEPSVTNPFGEPTDPFNPPYGTNQIVSVGEGGHLTLRFDTPVLNHPNNRFGLDFTIFGNAGFIITNEFDLVTFDWIGTPATDGSLFGSSEGEIVVSVSRDGLNYFPLNPDRAPRIDGFPPSDSSGDSSLPVLPGLSIDDFAGATLEDIRTLYSGSAGGASFDLAWAIDEHGQSVHLPEVHYIRVDVLTGRAEIDAITKVDRAPRGPRTP